MKSKPDRATSRQIADERALWRIVIAASADWETVEGSPAESPREVAEILNRLHQEAQQRFDDLKPKGINIVWLILLGLGGVALVVSMALVGWWGLVVPLQTAATQTAVAQQASDASQTRAAQTTASANGTAEFFAQQTATAALETARAAGGNEAAQTQAAQQAATATAAEASRQTALAADKTAEAVALATRAEANRCQAAGQLSLETSRASVQPPRGTVYIPNNPEPYVAIQWSITNTSPSCAWQSIELVQLSDTTGQPLPVVVTVNGQRVDPAQAPLLPGTNLVITLAFPFAGAEAPGVVEEWVVIINGQAMLNPRVTVNVKGWVVRQTPTPSPMPPATTSVVPTWTPKPPDDGGGGDDDQPPGNR